MRLWQRWAPPVVAVAAVAAYAVVPAVSASGAVHPSLPVITPAQLLAKVESSTVRGLTGTVHESADLGLPALPAGDGSAFTDLLSGSHTLQLAVAPGSLRLAVLGQLSEQDVVVSGGSVTTYDSTTGQTTRTALPAHHDAPPQTALDPQQAADRAIAALDPTTVVSVDDTTRVAGRDAYTLVLTPRTTSTLVARVEVAVDAANGAVLRTAVYAVGRSAPAFETAFTSISYAVPPASAFTLDAPTRAAAPRTTTFAPRQGSGAPSSSQPVGTSTIGSGWSAVTRIDGLHLTADQQRQLTQVSTAVPAGRLISTRLLTVLITPDGTAYVGAVPASVLEQDAR